MANETIEPVDQANNDTQSSTIIKLCPICGSELYEGEMYGFPAWICPQEDWFEFID